MWWPIWGLVDEAKRTECCANIYNDDDMRTTNESMNSSLIKKLVNEKYWGNPISLDLFTETSAVQCSSTIINNAPKRIVIARKHDSKTSLGALWSCV